jgi:hypothetical protein
VTKKMAHDKARGAKSQLFVAHSSALCRNARSICVRECGEGGTEGMDFLLYRDILHRLERKFGLDSATLYPPEREIDYGVFLRELWPQIKDRLAGEKRKAPSGRLVWTKVASFIKGSLEALQEGKGGALSQEGYLALGEKHDRLGAERRKVAPTTPTSTPPPHPHLCGEGRLPSLHAVSIPPWKAVGSR